MIGFRDAYKDKGVVSHDFFLVTRIERSTVRSARQITVLGNKADQTSQALRPRIIGADVTLQAPIARPKKEAEAHLSRGRLQPGRLREGRASESTSVPGQSRRRRRECRPARWTSRRSIGGRFGPGLCSTNRGGYRLISPPQSHLHVSLTLRQLGRSENLDSFFGRVARLGLGLDEPGVVSPRPVQLIPHRLRLACLQGEGLVWGNTDSSRIVDTASQTEVFPK